MAGGLAWRFVDFVGRLVCERHAQAGVRGPALDLDGQVDARYRVFEAPVERGLQQRKQQRRVAHHFSRAQHLTHFDAAGVDLAAALAQRFVQEAREVEPFVGQLHAAVAQAHHLLAHDAGAPCAVDFFTQQAQAGAVDLAGGGECGHAFQR